MRKSIWGSIWADTDLRVSGPTMNILQPKRAHKSERNIHIPAGFVQCKQTRFWWWVSGTATANPRVIKYGHISPLKYFHQGQVGCMLRTEVWQLFANKCKTILSTIMSWSQKATGSPSQFGVKHCTAGLGNCSHLWNVWKQFRNKETNDSWNICWRTAPPCNVPGKKTKHIYPLYQQASNIIL